MSGWLTVLSAIFQIVLLLIQSHNTKETDAKQAKADQANAISNAIASGSIANINSVVGKLRNN